MTESLYERKLAEIARYGGEYAAECLASLVETVAASDEVCTRWATDIARDLRAREGGMWHALFGYNLFDKKAELLKLGFRFFHRREGYGYFRTSREIDEEMCAELTRVLAVDGVACWEIVPEHGVNLDTSAARVELVEASAGTSYSVVDRGSVVKIRKNGRTLKVIKNYLEFRRWYWVLCADRRKGEKRGE